MEELSATGQQQAELPGYLNVAIFCFIKSSTAFNAEITSFGNGLGRGTG